MSDGFKYPYESFNNKRWRPEYPGEVAATNKITAQRTYTSTLVPDANHDGWDSNGVGYQFEIGDHWHNTISNIWYFCESNSKEAAVWNISYGNTTEVIAQAQTTDETQTTCGLLTLADGYTYNIEAVTIGIESDGTNRASYNILVTVYREGGGAAIQGTATSTHSEESDASWNALFAASGNDIRLSVTGAAATTIYWKTTLRYTKINH